MRLLEMRTDRFGLFEALAHSTLKLNRFASADELAMDPQVAEAVLEPAHRPRRLRRLGRDKGAVAPRGTGRQRG